MLGELSPKVIKNYLSDALKIRFSSDPVLKPLIFIYYITSSCNFRCSFCGFAQGGIVSKESPELDSEDSIRLLRIIGKSCPNIYFTGGEPLVRKDIVEIVAQCKELGFRSVSINTNLSLIHQKMELLDYIDNLVASLNCLDDEKSAKIHGVSERVMRQVKDNLVECSKLQKEKKFALTVNCVITPETIEATPEVMNFCFENNIRFASVPVHLDHGEPDKSLMDDENYRDLIRYIIKCKKKGLPVFGSFQYLDHILDFQSFHCYPTLTPHIYTRGELLYPCEPMQRVSANLLECGSYEEAYRQGREKYGRLPMCTGKCYKACYIEPSQFIQHPWLMFRGLNWLSK
jgi:MoaA/NifB/PqqE/SkfB family radical SAM enzyme